MNVPSVATQSTQPTGAPAASGAPASATGNMDQLTNESTFLQLLVAQIQNQDPMNPTDSIQFVGQLVSFSQLEQLLSINQNMQTLVKDVNPPSTPSTPSSTSGTTN